MLNAKPEHAAREAETVAEAGQPGAVTIATNMAGRGVDIKLGGNPEHLARLRARQARASSRRRRGLRASASPSCCRRSSARWRTDRERVMAAGGLFICGTERHESRRIDNQLRGRSGRQGDPGETRFFLSAEDDLVRLFAGDRIYQHPRPTRRRRRGGQRGTDRGGHALQADRESPEEGRGAELPDPQARARVRRRDERAAPRHLRLPRRGARRARRSARRRARRSRP